MKNWLRPGIYGAVVAGLALSLSVGCDDAATSGDPVTGGDGSVPIDSGLFDANDGGDASVRDCVRDSECNDDEYCRTEGGALEGVCDVGCRDGADCGGDGWACNLDTRTCGCTGDGACGDGQYCGPDGACLDGCTTDDHCSGTLTEDGRSTGCDDSTHTCEPLFACCEGAAASACGLTLDGQCEGVQLLGALSCSRDACGEPCPGGDADCDEGYYCSPIDARCQEGCRLEDAEACPPGQICDPDKRTCEDAACQTDDQCPEGNYCDNGPGGDGLCHAGCREGECAEGEICDNNERVCRSFCDAENLCPGGAYCDEGSSTCIALCDDHEDCPDGRFCDGLTGECPQGCRDDQDGSEPNDLQDTATLIPLFADPNLADVRRGGVADHVICSGNPDFYAIELEQGERLQVTLLFSEEEGDLDLRLHGEAVEDGPIVRDQFQATRIRYPAVGTVEDATTYYPEVYGDFDGILPFGYALDVVVVSAEDPCFPDDYEVNNSQGTATELGRQPPEVVASICRDDQDWFRIPMLSSDGLNLDLYTSAGSAPIELLLYSASRLAEGGGLGNPNVVIENGEIGGDGRTLYQVRESSDGGTFSDEDWFILVQGVNVADIAEYSMGIEVVGGAGCQTSDDGNEPNDTIEQALSIDDIDAITEGGLLTEGVDVEVPFALELCPGDVDWFCTTAEADNILRAWVTSDTYVGVMMVSWWQGQSEISAPVGFGATDEPPAVTTVRGTDAGTYCVRVEAIAGGRGDYTLNFSRTDTSGQMCGGDPEVEEGVRNDNANTATDMNLIEDRQGSRLYQADALMCQPDETDDTDWYRFPVPDARSRICVTVDAFEQATADLEIEMYRDIEFLEGDPCVPEDVPVPNGRVHCSEVGGGACVQGRCLGATTESITNYEAEMIAQTPGIVGARTGDYLVRVFRSGGAQDGDRYVDEGYRISATITPEAEVCAPDWQNENNEAAAARQLGAGQIAMCNAWFCDGQESYDYYDVFVPAGEDRTVIIGHQNNEGITSLRVEGPIHPGDLDGFSGMRWAIEDQGNYQCVNVKGGSADATISLAVAPDLFRSDRLDYTLRVLPTDLDARVNGECEIVIGPQALDACPDVEGDPIDAEPMENSCYMRLVIP